MKPFTLAALTALLLGASALSANAADAYQRGGLKDGPAVADEPILSGRSWQGPYVALGLGYRWQDWGAAAKAATCDKWWGDTWDGKKSDCKEGHYDGPEKAFSEDSNGLVVTGRAGYDWQRDRVVFGFFGEGNWLNANTDAFADAKFSGAIGGRLGYLLNPSLLAYINGGVEFTKYNEDLDTQISPFVGGGLELLLADGWSVAPEARLTFKDDNSDLPAGIDQDEAVTARILLLKKF